MKARVIFVLIVSCFAAWVALTQIPGGGQGPYPGASGSGTGNGLSTNLFGTNYPGTLIVKDYYNPVTPGDNLFVGENAGNITLGANGGSFGSYNAAFGTGALTSDTDGSENVAVGRDAAFYSTTGWDNAYVGEDAGFSNTIGSFNTAIGQKALFGGITGSNNVAIGEVAMYSNTFSSFNVAIGQSAMSFADAPYCVGIGAGGVMSSNLGAFNTAVGAIADVWTTSGSNNVAVGYAAMNRNTTGRNDTGVGMGALQNNSTGNANTGVGAGALQVNTTGLANTGLGWQALGSVQTGNNGTAVGELALQNTTASGNTAVGQNALNAVTSGANNTAVGLSAGLGSGNENSVSDTSCTFLGANARHLGDTATAFTSSTALGAAALVSATHQVMLGTTNEFVEAPGSILTPMIYYRTNNFPLIAGAINVDFRSGANNGCGYQFISTNANFTIAGFANISNNVVNQVWVSISNSSASSITVTWPGAPVRNFGTNTATTGPISAGKVAKMLWQVDPHGTNLIWPLMQNN